MVVNDEKRKKFFLVYSENLKMVTSEVKNKIGYQNDYCNLEEVEERYICPICAKIFEKQSIFQNKKNPNPLTLEDVPPKKLGGKPILLTCKRCNNEIGGRQLDSKLKWSLEAEPFLKGKPNSKIEAFYTINQRTKARGTLTRLGEKSYKIDFYPKTNPNLGEALEELKQNKDKNNIKFRIQYPRSKKVLLALLRISYLKMFTVFGYGYFFNKSSQIIREQIYNPDKDLIPDFGIPLINIPNYSEPGIFLVKKPNELKSYLVVFDLILSGGRKTYSVLIPGPKQENIDIYSAIRENSNYKIDILPIPNVDYLTNKANILAYNEIWDFYDK